MMSGVGEALVTQTPPIPTNADARLATEPTPTAGTLAAPQTNAGYVEVFTGNTSARWEPGQQFSFRTIDLSKFRFRSENGTETMIWAGEAGGIGQ